MILQIWWPTFLSLLQSWEQCCQHNPSGSPLPDHLPFWLTFSLPVGLSSNPTGLDSNLPLLQETASFTCQSYKAVRRQAHFLTFKFLGASQYEPQVQIHKSNDESDTRHILPHHILDSPGVSLRHSTQRPSCVLSHWTSTNSIVTLLKLKVLQWNCWEAHSHTHDFKEQKWARLSGGFWNTSASFSVAPANVCNVLKPARIKLVSPNKLF